MKLYVKQMQDWNCYALIAEDVEEEYQYFFKNELWWQIKDNFIKTYDNVPDFPYCAENFAKYGEAAIKQQLKVLPCPWESALDFMISEMETLGVDWYIHGSVAMALHGAPVIPKNLNIIIPNYSDFDKVREHFCKLAIQPFERCDGWIMSGLGNIFHDAWISFAFHNKELEPFDMGTLAKPDWNGKTVYTSTLEMLKNDNAAYGRMDRVKMMEERM